MDCSQDRSVYRANPSETHRGRTEPDVHVWHCAHQIETCSRETTFFVGSNFIASESRAAGAIRLSQGAAIREELQAAKNAGHLSAKDGVPAAPKTPSVQKNMFGVPTSEEVLRTLHRLVTKMAKMANFRLHLSCGEHPIGAWCSDLPKTNLTRIKSLVQQRTSLVLASLSTFAGKAHSNWQRHSGVKHVDQIQRVEMPNIVCQPPKPPKKGPPHQTNLFGRPELASSDLRSLARCLTFGPITAGKPGVVELRDPVEKRGGLKGSCRPLCWIHLGEMSTATMMSFHYPTVGVR